MTYVEVVIINSSITDMDSNYHSHPHIIVGSMVKHVIARRDQFIMNYTEDDVAAMPCLTRRKMVQNLERLEAVYARELQLREIGQRTIHSYFQPTISQENNNEEMVLSERPSAAHST